MNLLSTLQLVARGRLRIAEERPAGAEPANNNFLTISLPDGGLTYLMNILEDRSARADVLAKPSLVAPAPLADLPPASPSPPTRSCSRSYR